MADAHDTEICIPAGENIIYISIKMNFSVQLIGMGINSTNKMQGKKKKRKKYLICL